MLIRNKCYVTWDYTINPYVYKGQGVRKEQKLGNVNSFMLHFRNIFRYIIF